MRQQHKIMYIRKPHVRPGRSKIKLAKWAVRSARRQKGGFLGVALAAAMPYIISGVSALATGAAGAVGAWGANKAISSAENSAARKKAKQAKARKYVLAQQKKMRQAMILAKARKQRR